MTEGTSTGYYQVARLLAGRYRLVSFIARGGMAEVWEGHDELLARSVAVKLPLTHLSGQAGFTERFRREAVAAARLSHPNVVAVYDIGEDGDDSFIVMERVYGYTLRQVLDGRHGLDVPSSVAVAFQVASALDFAHRHGVIHRDVKPANILITADNTVKVADFGIAKAAIGPDATQTSVTLGTARYISPEQAEGHVPDGRSDLYSLGVVLYEMLCGQPPFQADNEVALAIKHIRTDAAPVAELCQGVPPWLEKVVAQCLAKRPSDRLSGAGEFAAVLSEQAAASSLWATSPSGPGPQVVPSAELFAHLPKLAPLEPNYLMGTTAATAFGSNVSATTGGNEPGQSTSGPSGWDSTGMVGLPSARGGSDPTTALSDAVGLSGVVGTSFAPGEVTSTTNGRVRNRRSSGRAGEAHRRRWVPSVVGAISALAVVTVAILGFTLMASSGGGPTAPPTAPAPAPSTTLTISSAIPFDTAVGADMSRERAGITNIFDGNPDTFWVTQTYASRNFGNLAEGVGVVLNLSSTHKLAKLVVDTPTPGWNASVYVAGSPQATLAAWGRPLDTMSGVGSVATFDLHATTGSSILVWITLLSPNDLVKIAEVHLSGT
ncbi:MAG: protein kinase domain-containing protein [Acidimicrobiales bacterium]